MKPEDFIAEFRRFKGAGPKPYEDIFLTNLVDQFGREYPDRLDLFRSLLPDNQECLISHMHSQPRGYPGDFELIEKFYTFTYVREVYHWDRYTLFHDGGQAIRNRVFIFKRLVDQLGKKRRHSRLLDLGCGAGYPIYEFLKEKPYQDSIQYTGLDIDGDGIDLARKRMMLWNGDIRFLKGNVVSMSLPHTFKDNFNLIWSGGLFDYMTDKLFIRLLKKYFQLLVKGGELVIGNFHPKNPSRMFMDLLNWKLIYRTESELRELVRLSNIPAKSVRVSSEEQGINLFLHCKK